MLQKKIIVSICIRSFYSIWKILNISYIIVCAFFIRYFHISFQYMIIWNFNLLYTVYFSFMIQCTAYPSIDVAYLSLVKRIYKFLLKSPNNNKVYLIRISSYSVVCMRKPRTSNLLLLYSQNQQTHTTQICIQCIHIVQRCEFCWLCISIFYKWLRRVDSDSKYSNAFVLLVSASHTCTFWKPKLRIVLQSI